MLLDRNNIKNKISFFIQLSHTLLEFSFVGSPGVCDPEFPVVAP